MAVKHKGCPECHAPAAEGFRPFCSKRCADVDLARWLTGTYAIPGGTVTDDAEDDSAQPDAPLS